jgi:hypothetical protein
MEYLNQFKINDALQKSNYAVRVMQYWLTFVYQTKLNISEISCHIGTLIKTHSKMKVRYKYNMQDLYIRSFPKDVLQVCLSKGFLFIPFFSSAARSI